MNLKILFVCRKKYDKNLKLLFILVSAEYVNAYFTVMNYLMMGTHPEKCVLS